MKFIFSLALIIFCFFYFPVLAQSPQVPKVIQFADLELRLNEQARREIQQDVDALYRSPTYFKIKLDRVNLYMPIIERVLKEQGVPEDLKYLVIQESSLISDAVSTSNAVGFWQFKKGTAEEVFLRVDNQIDERKNIVSSTKGAALYLKKHQNYLDNWACALVSYQMGLGGARRYFGDKYKGKRTMNLDRNSHWYLKKFLAHKIAFEGQLGKPVGQGGFLQEYRVTEPTTLAELASRLGVSENHLREQNKWTSNGKIPADRPYTVTYVQKGLGSERPVLASNNQENSNITLKASHTAQQFPEITGNRSLAGKPGQIRVNGIKGILAKKTTSQEEFSALTGLRNGKIRRVNDLHKSDKIIAGNYYYTKRKKGKAQVEAHVVRPGETLWEISQIYGIRLHSLKAKNRIYKDADLKPGMVLKLQEYRRRNEEIAYVKLPPLQADNPARPEKSVPSTSPPHRQGSTVNSSIKTENQDINHLVEAGDTLYAISRKYEVTVNDLRKWNNLNNDNLLNIGQVIIIKK